MSEAQRQAQSDIHALLLVEGPARRCGHAGAHAAMVHAARQRLDHIEVDLKIPKPGTILRITSARYGLTDDLQLLDRVVVLKIVRNTITTALSTLPNAGIEEWDLRSGRPTPYREGFAARLYLDGTELVALQADHAKKKRKRKA